jgi:hypothetical protein
VDAGLLSADEADAAAARFSENVRLLTPMMMAGIGRRACVRQRNPLCRRNSVVTAARLS